MRVKSLALCAGRHEMPDCVDGAIFSAVINPLDTDGMYETAKNAVAGLDALNLYVTGLTVALIEVIKACNDLNINLICWHYDKDTISYYAQKVLSFDVCPFCHKTVPASSWGCPHCGAT